MDMEFPIVLAQPVMVPGNISLRGETAATKGGTAVQGCCLSGERDP